MIKYFQKDPRLFIQAQLDVQDKDLGSWDEVVDKTVDVEAKAKLQTLFRTREIDS